jgi:hypothetical protein
MAESVKAISYDMVHYESVGDFIHNNGSEGREVFIPSLNIVFRVDNNATFTIESNEPYATKNMKEIQISLQLVNRLKDLLEAEKKVTMIKSELKKIIDTSNL